MSTLIDKVALIQLHQGKILMTRSRGKKVWYIPGGKREAGETDKQTLLREIDEELKVQLFPHLLQKYGVFTAQADGKADGIEVQMTCYQGIYQGRLEPANEIEEFAYFDYSQKHRTSPVDQLIFDDLHTKGLLVDRSDDQYTYKLEPGLAPLIQLNQKLKLPDDEKVCMQVVSRADLDLSTQHPAIIVIHGWKSRTLRFPQRLRFLLEAGYIVAFFELRGMGRSPYELDGYSIQDHLDDVIRVYDALAKLPEVNAAQIAAFGSSYGGYLSLLLSAQRPLSAQALICPAQYPDEWFKINKSATDRADLLRFRQQVVSKDSNRSLAALAAFAGPVLLIESEDDATSPGKQTYKDFKKYLKQTDVHHLLNDADHALYLGDSDERMIQVVTAWFKDQL